MLVHLSLFVFFQGVETSDTCVGTPQSVVCLFQGVETSDTCVGTPQSVCVVSES